MPTQPNIPAAATGIVCLAAWLVAGAAGCAPSTTPVAVKKPQAEPQAAPQAKPQIVAKAGVAGEDAEQSCSVLASLPYWAEKESIASFKKNIDVIDHISVFWYHLDPDGNILTYKKAHENRALIEFAHDHGVKVFGLIANLPDDERGEAGDWDAARVGKAIAGKARRAAHIAELMALARRMNFDGILIDYEALPGEYRETFTSFIKELGAALHAEDKLLAVAILPKTSADNWSEDNGSRAQDLAALQQHADQLHFMTYSQHTASTPPGPAAKPEWIKRIFRYALAKVKLSRDKVYMGVPLYAEEWVQLGPEQYDGLDIDYTFADVQHRKRKHHSKEIWSAEGQSPYIEYTDNHGKKRIMWFENKQSSARKLDLGLDLGVCNIALWRLGDEDPGFWDLVRDPSYRRPRAHPLLDKYLSEADEDSDASTVEQEASEEEESQEASEEEESQEASEEESQEASEEEESDGGSERYPRLEGEASAVLEYYTKFAATDPMNEHDNWITNIDIDQTLSITSRLAVVSDVRLVLESDGEDPRFYTDYPYEGVYIRELRLQYDTKHVSVFGGKYESASGIRRYAPIFFGNYCTELNLSRRVGVGAAVRLGDESSGQHSLTAHLFYRDTSRLSGEVLSEQGRNRLSDGGVANTGRPNNMLVTVNGSSPDARAMIHYTLGGGVQQGTGDALDEHIYLGALNGELEMGRYGDLELSLDLLSLGNAGGRLENRHYVLLGAGYSRPRFYIGAGYSLRFVEAEQADSMQKDQIMEIVSRYDISEHIKVEAAYQQVREDMAVDHSFGIALAYAIDWLVP